MILAFQWVSFLAAFVLCYCLTPLFISAGHSLKLLDYPHDRKSHPRPTSFLGGGGIFLCFWIVYGLLYFFLMHSDIAVSHNTLRKMIGVFSGALIIFTLGFLDDKFELSPVIKLLGQGAAAFLLMQSGLMVNLLAWLDGLGYVATFVWILLIMNAFNFIDSVDGHCAGIALISCFVFYGISTIVYQPVLGAVSLIMAGAILGFMPYNWKPARIFLGDNGSMFIGYMMAAMTLLFSYRTSQYSIVTPFIPIFMFGVPIYDTVSVVMVRIFRGIPPWKGDRNHFAHRLVRLGMGEKIAVLVSYFIAFTLGLVALLSTQVDTSLGKGIILCLFVSVIGIIALLEYYAAMRIRIIEHLSSHHRRRSGDILDAEEKGKFGSES